MRLASLLFIYQCLIALIFAVPVPSSSLQASAHGEVNRDLVRRAGLWPEEPTIKLTMFSLEAATETLKLKMIKSIREDVRVYKSGYSNTDSYNYFDNHVVYGVLSTEAAKFEQDNKQALKLAGKGYMLTESGQEHRDGPTFFFANFNYNPARVPHPR